jgi:hypothetical protein
VKAAILFSGQGCILFSAMSDVKPDRDLGGQNESGASKRKREAELERKNLELSGSLLHFLKRIEEASLSKCKIYVKLKVEGRWKTCMSWVSKFLRGSFQIVKIIIMETT